MKNKILLITIFVFASFIAKSQTDSSAAQKPDTATTLTFSYMEKMPEFPGSFVAYVNTNLKYPAKEKKEKREGTVYVSFVIEKDGSVSGISVVKEVPNAPGFTTEAIRLITAMPNWKPGEMNGKPVRVQMTQPIRFILQ